MGRDATKPPVIVSICGPSSSGKSQLAKAVVAAFGTDRCERVVTDYFLDLPTEREGDPAPDRFAFSWDLIDAALCQPLGTAVTTPDVDFDRLVRRAPTGGLPFTVRPVMITDGFAPHPRATVRVRLTAPVDVRRARLIARDARWGSRVIDRFAAMERTWAAVDIPGAAWDLDLPGEAPISENARRVAALISGLTTMPGAPAQS